MEEKWPQLRLICQKTHFQRANLLSSAPIISQHISNLLLFHNFRDWGKYPYIFSSSHLQFHSVRPNTTCIIETRLFQFQSKLKYWKSETNKQQRKLQNCISNLFRKCKIIKLHSFLIMKGFCCSYKTWEAFILKAKAEGWRLLVRLSIGAFISTSIIQSTRRFVKRFKLKLCSCYHYLFWFAANQT